MTTWIHKQNAALRIEFIRSVLTLPCDEETEALARSTLFSFIRDSALDNFTREDEAALRQYLQDAVSLNTAADMDVLAAEIAMIATQVAEGTGPLDIPAPGVFKAFG
jgi:hypothetical protein